MPLPSTGKGKGNGNGNGNGNVGEREFVGLLAAISATTALGIDMVLPAFGEIRGALELAPDSPRVALTVTVYFLGLALAQVFYGPFTDRFGRKPVLYFGLGLYALGALGSALATSFEMLIALRFIWGVGAAGPRALTLAIGRDLYDGDRLARILALATAVFMIVPALGPLIGEGVLSVGSWRWVMATPILLIVALMAWITRLPETLTPERRRPLTFIATRSAIGKVFATRTTLGSALALMFDFGAFAVFLASSELLFDVVYGRSEQFAYFFAAMSLVMGTVVFTGSRIVRRRGADQVVATILPFVVALAIALAFWSWRHDGQPNFWIWFGTITVINSLRTLTSPLIQAKAMEPMAGDAGTAAAVVGTLSMGGGAILASFIDRLITDSVTPLAVAYAGYGTLSVAALLWSRAIRWHGRSTGATFRP